MRNTNTPSDTGERLAEGRGFRALASDTVVYGFARAVFALVGFVLVPLYTRYFSVADYGVIENLNVLGFFTVTLFGAALPTAVVQSYSRAKQPERVEIVASAAYGMLALAGALLGAGLLASHYLGPLLVRRSADENGLLLALAFASYAAGAQISLFLSVFRARFDSRSYLVASLGCVALTVMLNLILVVGLGWGIAGTLVASLIAQVATCLYCVSALREFLGVRAVRPPILVRMLVFGFPFLFAAVLATVTRSSDRYFLSALLEDPLPRIGLYSMAEKCMAPLSLLTYAFGTAWAPFAMTVSEQSDSRDVYLRCFKYYVAVTSTIAVLGSALAPFVLRLLTPPAYHAAASLTPGVGLYLPLHYLYYIGSLGLLLTGRSMILAPIVLISAGANVALNLLWIPRFGVEGAIASTIVALLVYNALMFRAGEQRHAVGFPFLRGLVLYGLGFACAVLALRGPAAALVAVALQLSALRFFGFLELERLQTLVAQWRGARA